MTSDAQLRVFIDTNVLFAALHSPRGTCSRLLALLISRNATIVISVDVLSELAKNIANKMPHALGALGVLMTEASLEVITRAPIPDVRFWTSRGFRSDAAIVAAALLAGVDYFCTGDRGILNKAPLCEASGLKLITPADLLRELALQ